jgi:hypothetical protein
MTVQPNRGRRRVDSEIPFFSPRANNETMRLTNNFNKDFLSLNSALMPRLPRPANEGAHVDYRVAASRNRDGAGAELRDQHSRWCSGRSFERRQLGNSSDLRIPAQETE